MTDQLNSISIGRKGGIGLSMELVQPCIFKQHFKIQAGSPVTVPETLFILIQTESLMGAEYHQLSCLGFYSLWMAA